MNWMRGMLALAGLMLMTTPLHATVKQKDVFYALYVIDGRAPNGDVRLDFSEGAKLDYEALHYIFNTNLKNNSEYEYRSMLLLGDDVTPESILSGVDYIRSHSKKDDRFLFFYRGHAAMVDGDMIFRLKTKKLSRSMLIERVRSGQNEPQAIFILSDACAPTKETPVVDATTIPMGLTLPDLKLEDFATPLFKSLFLDSAGLVDINSAKPGSDSWSIGGRGLFTNRLIRTMQQEKHTVDTNKDGTVAWSEFFTAVDHWSYKYLERLKSENPGTGLVDAPEQRAVAFSLGDHMWATRTTYVKNIFNVPMRMEVRSYVYNISKKSYEWQSMDFSVKAKETVSLGKAEANQVQWRRLDLSSGAPLEAFTEVTHQKYVRNDNDPGVYTISPAKWLYPYRRTIPEPVYYAPLPDPSGFRYNPPPTYYNSYPQPYYNPYQQPYYNPYQGYPPY